MRLDHRYDVLQRLSSEQSTQVYQVRDLVSGRLRVLKGVEGEAGAPAVLQLRREYQLLARVHHPRVVQAGVPGLSPGNPPFHYFTLDYVEGQNLRSLLGASLPEQLQRFAELAEAVSAVHAHGLRCGDLKPENVLLGAAGVQLIDFGLSREAESLEVTQLPTGTLPYMAPEVLQGHAADLRADLFSLGVILFELLTGEVPFAEATTLSARIRAWQGLTQSPQKLLAERLSPERFQALPPALLELIELLLAPHPAARAGHLERVRRMLERVVEDLGLPPLPAWPSFLAEQPLTGRAESLAQLQQHWEAADRGGARLLCLEGAPGMGRSRLLAEWAEQQVMPSRGLLLWLSRAEEGEAAQRLLAWLAGEAASSNPEWLESFQQRIAHAFHRGEPLPTILLDAACLEACPSALLSRWMQALADNPPPVWLGMALPPGISLRPNGGWSVMSLQGLSEEAVRSMVERATGLVRAPETIARFHRFSQGNPAILRAILLHPGEMEAPSASLLALLEPLVWPALQGLSVELKALAAQAALLYEPFHWDHLVALGELARPVLEEGVLKLQAEGVLTPELGVPGGWHFTIPMQRAVLAASLPPARRLELHRRVSRWLERRAQLGGQVSNAALAWHWDRAEDFERARRYLGRALRDAVAANAWLEAHDLCLRLLELLADDDPERVRIDKQLGDINLSLQRFPQAEAAYLAALKTLELEPELDPLVVQLRGELCARLARAREERGDFVGAREALEHALTLHVADDPGELGRLHLALARVSHREKHLKAAKAALERGLALLGPGLKPEEMAEAHLLDGLIQLDSGKPHEAAEPLKRALELATQHQLLAARRRALHNLHIVEVRTGNLARAVEYLQQALEAAESAGDVARLGAGYNNLGNLQRRLGDVRKALKSYRRALQTFERVGDKAGQVTVHYSLANLLRERGELGRALEHLETADAIAATLGGGFRAQAGRRTRLLRGEVLLALGQPDEAQVLLLQSQAEAEASVDTEALLASELALAEVSLARGETLEVEKRCIELAGRVGSESQAMNFSRTLGRLHLHLGHFYAQRYVQSCRDHSRQLLGQALLEQAQASLPEGVMQFRQRLEEAIVLLEQDGQGQRALLGRALLQDLGASGEERQELLGAVLDVLQNLGDRRQVLAYLVALSARLLRAERGLLLYRRKEGALIDFKVLHGMNLGEAQRVSGEVVRQVAATRQPVIIADALEEASLVGSTSIQDLQIRSVLGLPLDGDEAGMWILYLDHRQLPGIFQAQMGPLLERLRLFASGLLREIRWRETLMERMREGGRDSRRLGMVGVSRAIERVREYIENLGHLKLSNENLLFIGESGTGKELVARAVHQVVSQGRPIPFIAQSCADIPAELIESILFGHRRGAFTGAKEDRPGIFELANGGVLFLDEIGELPLNLQPTLLRVLEERAVARVGEPDKLHPLNLVVVFATNRDLAQEVAAGRFRRDLFHRLNQVFRLPPLRERREDILPLIEHFMAQVEDYQGLTADALFSSETLLWFHDHRWPGNIRELRNVVEAIPVRIKARRRQLVTLEDLGIRSDGSDGSSESPPDNAGTDQESLADFTDRIERGFIRRVMDQCGWDITRAASRLGITYQGLRKRLIKYDWMDEVERRRT